MNDFINSVIAFFGNVLNFLSGIKDYIWQLLTYALEAIIWFNLEFIRILFLGLESVVTGIITGLDFSGFLASSALDWSGVPPALTYVVVQVGIPQGLAILASAMVLRLTLNLIPAEFTRV